MNASSHIKFGRHWLRSALVLGGILAASCISGRASAQWTVSPTGNDNSSGQAGQSKLTIQAAINAANSGDTISVQPGTYGGAGNINLNFNGKNLILQAAFPGTVSIDGRELNVAAGFVEAWSQILQFDHNESSASQVIGITFQNAGGRAFGDYTGYNANPGGAIGISRGNPQILNCTFINCYTGEVNPGTIADGGAIAIGYASPLDNTWYQGLNPTISGCTFTNCRGLNGGAIAINANTATVSSCTFSNNWGTTTGGAISVLYGFPNITGCSFNDNYGDMEGGAIYLEGGNFNTNISTCSFTANSADPTYGQGGAIFENGARLRMGHSTFVANQAGQGGAVYSWVYSDNQGDAVSEMGWCSFAGNQENAVVTEMYGTNTTSIEIIYSIFWGNTCLGYYYSDEPVPVPGQLASNTANQSPWLLYCDVQGGYSGNGSLNINTDPQFVCPPSPGADGLWGSWGQGENVGANYGDLNLLPTSPCRNANCPLFDIGAY
jgi:hypothetical protein